MTAPDLIRRLEEAERGSRELDGDIHRLLFPSDLVMTDPGSVGPRARPAIMERIGDRPDIPDDVIAEVTGVPSYTTSLDAVQALVERLGLDIHRILDLALWWGRQHTAKPSAQDITLLACIAILRAHQKEPDHAG